MVSHAVGQVEQVGEHELRHRHRCVRGDVGHDDPPLSCRGNIHDIVAGGKDTDVPEPWELCDRFAPDRRFVCEKNLCVLRPRHDLLFGRPFVDGALAGIFKTSPGEISRIQTVSVKHNDLHTSSP